MQKLTVVDILAVECLASKIAVGRNGHVAYHAYAPFGYHGPMPGNGSEVAFMGEMLDHLAGNYLLGSRHYSPSLNRFSSADTWSPFGKGGINAYAGFGNNPVNNIDPDGHSFIGWLKAKLPFDTNTKRRYKTIEKFGLKGMRRLENDTKSDSYHNFNMAIKMSGSDMKRISNRDQLIGLTPGLIKYIYTSRGELIVGNAGKSYFAHPVLDGLSRAPGNVVAAGYIRYKDGHVLVNEYSGHYGDSMKGEDRRGPVLYYVEQFGLVARKVKFVRGSSSSVSYGFAS